MSGGANALSIPVTGKTKVLGVVGWPVSHSRSPELHNRAISKLGLDYVYVPYPVEPSNIADAIAAVRALGIAGINVTIPHKEAVIPFIDSLSKEARLIGAVNTIVNKKGKLHGHTTDPEGIMGALRRASYSIKGKDVVILGAGGAARTAVFTALLNGAKKITIIARNGIKAKKLADEVHKKFKRAKIHISDNSNESIIKASLLINATPIGMTTLSNKIPIDPSILHEGLTVFDMVYNPHDTMLLKAAAMAGAKCIHGIDMLIFQGMQSFMMWTGRKVTYDIFRPEKGYSL